MNCNTFVNTQFGSEAADGAAYEEGIHHCIKCNHWVIIGLSVLGAPLLQYNGMCIFDSSNVGLDVSLLFSWKQITPHLQKFLS